MTLGIVLRRLQRSLPGEARILAPGLRRRGGRGGGHDRRPADDRGGVRHAAGTRDSTAALADLARAAAVPVELPPDGDRAPPEVEAAAYYVACEALTKAREQRRPPRDGADDADGQGAAAARGRRRRRRRDVGGGSGLAGTRDRVAARAGSGARQPGRAGRGSRSSSMRVVIAEDTLLREGLAGLLEDTGHEVVGRAGDADTLLALVGEHAPDLAVVDVRVPPDSDDEGTRATAETTASTPSTAILVLLSAHQEHGTSSSCMVRRGRRLAACSRSRVLDVDDSSRQRCTSATAVRHLDRRFVATLIGAAGPRPHARGTSPRARGLLALMSRGPHEDQHWLAGCRSPTSTSRATFSAGSS